MAAASDPGAQRSKADAVRIAALALLLSASFKGSSTGGGGSRRFIYAPAKLDPDAASWMANNFHSAAPGALLGTDQILPFCCVISIFSDPVQRGRADRRTVVDDGLTHAGRSAGLEAVALAGSCAGEG